MIYRSRNRQLLSPQREPRTLPAGKRKLTEAPEFGFGSRASRSRLLNSDGSFNVKRLGEHKSFFSDAFHSLITMTWGKFFMMLLAGFLGANIVFATVYYLLGVEHLQGLVGTTFFDKISESFFFSTQTLTTLGYGRISPVGFWTSCVASVESMLGLLTFALATGLLYGRFSHPEAKIIYSKNAVIAPFNGGRALMVRLANGRRNQLIEIEALVILSRNELNDGGILMRKFYTMPLQISRVSVLASSWTIVHPIKEDSPLYGITESDIRDGETEVMVQIKAYDETYSQSVYSRTSYTYEEIVYGAKFISAISTDEDGSSIFDLGKMDEYETVALPLEKTNGVSTAEGFH